MKSVARANAHQGHAHEVMPSQDKDKQLSDRTCSFCTTLSTCIVPGSVHTRPHDLADVISGPVEPKPHASLSWQTTSGSFIARTNASLGARERSSVPTRDSIQRSCQSGPHGVVVSGRGLPSTERYVNGGNKGARGLPDSLWLQVWSASLTLAPILHHYESHTSPIVSLPLRPIHSTRGSHTKQVEQLHIRETELLECSGR